MKITKVTLSPFGGLANKELELRDGVNVIGGPNEAGKSTIFNAIQKVLFTPSKLKKKDFEKEIKRWLPLGGGDTVKVELEFENEGEKYTLKRMWGNSESSELILPNGGLVTKEDTIAKTLEPMLRAKEGTYRSVLMTYQSGLSRTLDDIASDEDTVYSLGDIVRKSMLETDGVQIDKFNDDISEEHKKYFDRWDVEHNRPENPKKRYTRGVGLILDSFYNKEDARFYLEEAQRFEKELDEINKEIAGHDKAIFRMQWFVDQNELVVDGIKERQTLEAKAKVLGMEVGKLSAAAKDWPVLEDNIKALESELLGIQEKLTAVQEEEKVATSQQEHSELIQRFTRVEGKKKISDEAQKKLESVKKLTTEEVDEIRESHDNLGLLKAKMAAGKLAIKFEAKKDMDISVQKDLDNPASRSMAENETAQFEAGGRLKIEHTDWNIEVTSGDSNVEEVIEEYNSAVQENDDLLAKYDVSSLKDAIAVNGVYQEHLTAFKSAESNLNGELGEDTYEELEQKIKQFGKVVDTRDIATIVEERSALQNNFNNQTEKLKEQQQTIADYVSDHESKEKLMEDFTEKMVENKVVESKIKILEPLPEGIDDADAFLQEFEETKDGLEFEKEIKNDLLVERAELDEPDISSEELEILLRKAEDDFHSVLRKGKAIEKIMEVTSQLSEEMDSDTFGDLRKDMEEYVSLMTNSRYSRIEMDEVNECLPEGFVRNDGEVLAYDLLSAGTKDVLSLALRISMANHFLGDDGFMIMDDPLVDMDPERQMNSAELLKKVANSKQILIFTCHPSHAELFEGNLQEL